MFPDSGNEKGSEVSNSTPRLSQKYCQFEFDEILLATDNFNESLVVGKGGFGKVYKGNISIATTHVDVAIKRLDLMSNQGATEFWAEVEMLSELRHAHLVSLIGYCNYEKEMILVYEYMPHGTLEDHLHKLHTPLSWVERLKICIGAARGLDYLHTGTGIEVGVIHRDVKSSNILLHESWAAKISDFGLARIGPTNQPSTYVNTLVKGTFGYIDPNYFATGKLTRKSDVYAFGVVLFEVLCQKRPLDESFECGLATWVQESIKEGNLKQIVYSGIRSEISPKCLKGFVRIAERCLDNYPNHRPTMTEVVYSLESLLAQSLLSSKPKTNNWLQTPGKKIFGRIFDVFPFSAPGENSISTPISGGEKSALSFIEHDEFLPPSSTNDVQSYLPQGMGDPYPYPKVARLFPEGLSAILQGVRIEHFGSVSTDFNAGNNLLLKALRAVTRKRLKNGNVSESMSFSAKELAFLEDDNALLGMEIIQESRYGDLFKTDIMKGGMLKTIAIKRIIHPPSETTKHNVVDLEKYSKKMRQIRSEIKTVGLIRHQNILPLLAHVSRTTCHYLVYEFMKFGSLQDILLRVQYGRQELEWIRRHKIAIGVANGLEYLHLSLPLRIVHRNLTPATIILDDNMEARISDFGLSRQIPHAKATIRSPDVAGSLGYIAPEYHQTLEFNEKVDIYSFGLLLGVLVVGKLPSDDFFPHTGEQSMVRWMRKVMTSDDQKEAIHLSLLGNGYEEQMLRVLKIACFCTLDNPEERPTSKDCRIMLSQIEH